eukprot:13677087-Ditylum_brightwellii.AAC.1
MAKVVRAGPYALAGAAFTRLVDVHGIKQIKHFLQHMRSDSQAHCLLLFMLPLSANRIVPGLWVSIAMDKRIVHHAKSYSLQEIQRQKCPANKLMMAIFKCDNYC